MSDRSLLPSSSHGWLFGTTTQRWLLVVGVFAVVGQCLLFVSVPPATDYETSVVTAYPLPFWVLFGVVLGSAVAVFLGSAVTNSGYWRHGFVLLACTYGLFLTLPLARGYALYERGGDDTLYHLAAIKTTLESGSIPDFLLYPLVHVLLSEVTIVGSPLTVARYVVPFVFAMILIGSTGLLVRELIGDERALPAGLCAATTLPFTDFHIHLHPALMSFMFFPLVVFALERVRRTGSKRYIGLAVTFVVATVFFHPITAAFLIVLIVSTTVFGYAYRWITRSRVRRMRPTLALVVVCAGTTWYVNFSRTQNAILNIVTGKSSGAAQQLGRANEAVLSTIGIAQRFVQLYGSVFVYLMVAGLFCLLVCYRLVRRRQAYSETYGSYQFAIGFAIAIAFLIAYLSTQNPIRISRYMILMAIVVVGVLLYQITAPVRTGYGRRIVTIALGCGIVLAAVLGAFAIYHPNKHMTQAEYEGAEFMARYPDNDLPVRSYDLTRKMHSYVTAGTDVEPYPLAYRQDERAYQLRPRLGYAGNATALESYGPSYLVTQEYATEQHTASYFAEAQQQKMFFYGDKAIRRLHRDPTADKIYANGGFSGWYVSGPDAS